MARSVLAMTNPHAVAFGLALKRALIDAQIPQRRLALHLDKSDQIVSDWINGVHEPPPRTAIEIERFVRDHDPNLDPGDLTQLLGFLPRDAVAITVATPEEAIIADLGLDGEVKQILLRQVRRERRASPQ